MTRYSLARNLPWSCEQLFDLAADVSRYPDFLPGWQEVQVLERSGQHMLVRQRLGLGPVHHTFTSKAELVRPQEVIITAAEAPFRHLHIHWQFEEPPQGGCRVSLGIELDIDSGILERALARMFEVTTPEIIAHFEVRARQLYGSKLETGTRS